LPIADGHTFGGNQIQEGLQERLGLLLLIELDEGIDEGDGNQNGAQIRLIMDGLGCRSPTGM
jgi:hypothetical protein